MKNARRAFESATLPLPLPLPFEAWAGPLAGRARGATPCRSPIDRAANSIIGNTAEGAGELSPNEKARFYRMARRSGIELAAWLEVVERRDEAPKDRLFKASTALEEIVSMLVALIERADRSP